MSPIAKKLQAPLRKPSLTISLAALTIQGILPPLLIASYAIARHLNFSTSGSKNSNGWRKRSNLSPPNDRRCGNEKAYWIGNLISGTPNCAFTPPSQNCTALWTIDWGWTNTCILSAGTPKSHLASITSKPLFIKDAESIVIFAPISHVGCLSASAAVTYFNCSWVKVRNGPPEQVRRIFSISFASSPTKLWKIALCSLSTGKIGTWYCWANWRINSPATTSVSLFAKHIFFFALIAWIVGARPE